MSKQDDFDIAEFVRRTRLASGVPERLEDPVVIDKNAAIFGSPDDARPPRSQPASRAPKREVLPERPKRKMPSLTKIAQWHRLNEIACVRCGYKPPVDTWVAAAGWLERAHVIDRVPDGVDFEANLRPLCTVCHRSQPIFGSGDEDRALAWFDGFNSDGTVDPMTRRTWHDDGR